MRRTILWISVQRLQRYKMIFTEEKLLKIRSRNFVLQRPTRRATVKHSASDDLFWVNIAEYLGEDRNLNQEISRILLKVCLDEGENSLHGVVVTADRS